VRPWEFRKAKVMPETNGASAAEHLGQLVVVILQPYAAAPMKEIGGRRGVTSLQDKARRNTNLSSDRAAVNRPFRRGLRVLQQHGRSHQRRGGPNLGRRRTPSVQSNS
jgi:hypothetical protein